MILLYIVLIVYILAVNFYSFLYIFAQYKAEKQTASPSTSAPEKSNPDERGELQNELQNGDFPKEEQLSVFDMTSNKQEQREDLKKAKKREKPDKPKKQSLIATFAPTPVKGFDWKLLLCASLGGAITIYVCMFIFKYKLNNLLLMLVLPILAAVSGYLWYLLFSSGFFIRT